MNVQEGTITNPSIPDEHQSSANELRIEDVVDLQVLQRIQDTFAKAMGVGAVTVGRYGNEITRPSNFQPICRLIRSTPAGLARCHTCDANGGRSAYLTGCPSTYICMSGLMDVAAPIIIEGQYLGCILCGQVLIENDHEAFLKNVTARSLSLGLPRAEVRDAIRQTPVIARERLDAAAEMLMLTANHIVEIGVANLIQARLLKETKEKAQMEAALKDAQLRALQAQIDPHFLFNSLTLVSYTAIEERASKTEEIAYILSDLLRYSLRNTSTMVSLGEEFRMIDHYLSLQQIRFGERFCKDVRIEPELENLPIPCMVLQPLVENAIVHGVESVPHLVRVSVFVRRNGDMVEIEISDNGVGMSTERVHALNERLIIPSSSNRPSLGLQSVIRRLEDEYGTHFKIHGDSRKGKGTTIKLSWPINAGYLRDRSVLTPQTESLPIYHA